MILPYFGQQTSKKLQPFLSSSVTALYSLSVAFASTLPNIIKFESRAKKAMKEHNAKGYIYKIYSNGDMVSCGEISIKSNNKTFVANSKQNIKSY